MHLDQDCSLLIFFSFFRRAFLGPGQRNPAFFSDDADGFWKLALFHFHDEAENVSALAAAEAMENLLHGVNSKGRSLLSMKRAQAGEILPALFQADVFAHHADNVRLLLHAIRK